MLFTPFNIERFATVASHFVVHFTLPRATIPVIEALLDRGVGLSSADIDIILSRVKTSLETKPSLAFPSLLYGTVVRTDALRCLALLDRLFGKPFFDLFSACPTQSFESLWNDIGNVAVGQHVKISETDQEALLPGRDEMEP